MDPNEVRNSLRAFVLKELLNNPSYPIEDDEPLITCGLVDSLSLALIGVFAEESFGVYIPDTDLTAENLDTLNQMVDRIVSDGNREA